VLWQAKKKAAKKQLGVGQKQEKGRVILDYPQREKRNKRSKGAHHRH